MCKNEEMLLLLSGHLDGCNTPEEEAMLEAHMAECPDCRRILTEYERFDAGIGDLTQEPPAGFTAGVMRAIKEDQPKAVDKKPRRFTFGFATAAAAVAAVFLLAIGSGMLPQLGFAGAKLNTPVMKSADIAPAAAEAEPAPEPEPEEAPAIELPEAAFSAYDQAAEAEKAVFQAEIVEIADGAMLVRPLEGCPEADYAPYVHVVIQNMAGSPEPRVGDVIEITYSGRMTEEDPPSPDGVARIQVVQHEG